MKYWIFAFVLAGVSFFALAYWIIPAFIFHPTKDMEATPSDIGLVYEDVRLLTPDGETIAAWFIPAPDISGPGQGLTLLFFHGNAGNISHRMESIEFFHTLGLAVFIIDYRGFGQSTGKPSVSGTIQDARAAWQWLTEQKGVPASHIVLFGRSLGGGVAAALAGEVAPRGLILESTFTSLYEVGKGIFPLLPRFVFREEYATLNNLKKSHAPLLVVHSPEDEVINYRMGREIFDSYTGPKTFLQISGSHNEGWISDLAGYEPGVEDFIRKLPTENL